MITIALADHHHVIRQGVRCLLEAEKDFQVVGEVADGLEVVGLIERHRPRVLIMAVGMPGLNSFEVTLRVRRRSPETAVILLSMYSGEHYVIEALRSGACGYVLTQARSSELIRAVRKGAAGHRYLSAPLSEHPIEVWLQRARSRALDPYEALTSREREVFNLVSEGHSSAAIARRLAISRRTAESHRANVMRKLRLKNQIDLIRFAITRGILTLPSDLLGLPDRGAPRPLRG
ncbi:MAG: response regulator transcription factor [Candidatus Rokuibacteriota bacterium]